MNNWKDRVIAAAQELELRVSPAPGVDDGELMLWSPERRPLFVNRDDETEQLECRAQLLLPLLMGLDSSEPALGELAKIAGQMARAVDKETETWLQEDNGSIYTRIRLLASGPGDSGTIDLALQKLLLVQDLFNRFMAGDLAEWELQELAFSACEQGGPVNSQPGDGDA